MGLERVAEALDVGDAPSGRRPDRGIVAMVISIVAGPRFINFLRLREYGQHDPRGGAGRPRRQAGHADDGRAADPVLGGVPYLILSNYSTPALTVFFCMVGCGTIGFLDDFIKLTHSRSLGLNGRWKLLAARADHRRVACVAHHRDLSTDLYIPGIGRSRSRGPGTRFLFLIIAGAANGVNLTDGIDGLAAGTGIIAVFTFTAMTVIAFIRSGPPGDRDSDLLDLSIVGAALIGAPIGFLWYNAFPAEVFMGDTGSMAIGGALAGFAIMTKTELLLLLVGGIFLIEALSVIAPGVLVQVLRTAALPDGADPPPLRDEGVVGDQDHGPLLDPDRDPLCLRLRAVLPLLLPLLPRRMTILVLDGDLVGDALAGLGHDELMIVIDPSADRLEELEDRSRTRASPG